MSLRDLAYFLLVALVFASGNAMAKYGISVMGIPPLFLASMRYLVAGVLLSHLLLPIPRPWTRVALGTLLLGAVSFGLFYVAMQHATAAAVSIVNLSQAPFGVLLAVLLLGERPSSGRIMGTVITLAGVAAVIYQPGALQVSLGLWIMLVSAFAAALGAIVCSRLKGIAPMRIQAWSGLLCFAALAPASLLFESGQWQAAVSGGWRFIGLTLYLGVVVSIFGLTGMFRMYQRHDANLMAGLNLVPVLMTLVLGVTVLGEPVSTRMIAGLLVSCLGVLVTTGQFDRVLPRPARPPRGRRLTGQPAGSAAKAGRAAWR